MDIDVVLPCLNEAAALPWVLSRMPPGYRPIVADNGSTDDSAAIAAAHGAYVVPVPQRGFGAACHAGLLAAASDIVCVMDADASFDPCDLPAVADPVRAGHFDLMLGRRSVQGKGAWPLHARIGNRVLAAELRRRIGIPVRDLGPMRAARREALLALPMSDRRFGYPLEMVVRSAAPSGPCGTCAGCSPRSRRPPRHDRPRAGRTGPGGAGPGGAGRRHRQG